MWSRWVNDHDIAHVQSKTIPMDLIWTESVNWLLINVVRKVPRAPAHVDQISKWPRHHTSTGKMVPMNMICSESAPWLPSSSIYSYCDTARVEASPKCWHFLQMTISNAFSWMKIAVLWSKSYWSLFQMTKSQLKYQSLGINVLKYIKMEVALCVIRGTYADGFVGFEVHFH